MSTFLESTSVVYEPSFLRRPDAMQAMLEPGSETNLIVTAPSGRLILTPLPIKDARSHALEALRTFLSFVTFRREIAAGEQGRAFRVPLSQIFTDMPDDLVDLNPPSIAFVPQPGPGVTDSMGMSGPQLLEETFGLYGPGTAVMRYGEYVEPFTIEVTAPKIAMRRALVAGIETVLRSDASDGWLRLTLPDFFGGIAQFELTGKLYIDDPYVAQNRRRAHLFVTLTVADLRLAHGLALMRPSVSIHVGAEIDVGVVPILQRIAPELSTEDARLLTRGY